MRAMYTFPKRYDLPTFRVSPERIQEIARALLAGDCSLHASSGEPDRIGEPAEWDFGYTVGGARPGLVDPTHPFHVEDWVTRLVSSEHYLPAGSTFGSWRDPKTGSLYIDVGSRHTSLRVAVEEAQDRAEKAIWDWGLQGSHRLTKNGLKWEGA